MSRPYKVGLVILLVCSAVITSVSGVLQSPRSTPDERHHYSKIKYIAEHFLAFPQDLSRIYTDRQGDPNHLIHPPLYYYIMATCYLILKPTKDFTSIGRETDRYGKTSSIVVIPLLRAASQFLAFFGLWGVYLLVDFMVSKCGLKPWLALVGTGLTTLVPAYTYIGAALNNDALVLGLWPFVVLCSLQFVFYGKAGYFWKSIFFFSMAVLTKATMWPLVLGFFLIVVVKLVSEVNRQGLSFFSFRKKTVERPTKGIWPERIWLFIGLLSVCPVIVVLGRNYLQYGTIQPGYTRVFNIHSEKSKFYHKSEVRLEEIEATTFWDITGAAAARFIESTAGMLGHRERFRAKNPAQLVMVFGMSVALLFLFGLATITNPRVCFFEKLVVVSFWLIPSAMSVLLLVRIYLSYQDSGYFAAHGRYLIGYLHILIFGLFIAVSRAEYRSRKLNHLRSISVVFAIAGLAFVLLRPLSYLHSSAEVFKRARISKVVNTTLLRQGYRRLKIEWAVPRETLTAGPSSDSGYFKDYYTLDWPNVALGGPIPVIHEPGVLHVTIWAKGDTELGDKSRLRVGLGSLSHPDSTILIPQEPQSELEIRDDVDLYQLDFRVDGIPDNNILYVQLLNHTVTTGIRLERWWPMSRAPRLLGLFYKFVIEAEPDHK